MTLLLGLRRESPAPARLPLPSVSRPSRVFGFTGLPGSLTFVSAASEGKQYLWMGVAGHLERTDLSVGTLHTVTSFSTFKILFIFGCAGSCCTGLSLVVVRGAPL